MTVATSLCIAALCWLLLIAPEPWENVLWEKWLSWAFAIAVWPMSLANLLGWEVTGRIFVPLIVLSGVFWAGAIHLAGKEIRKKS